MPSNTSSPQKERLTLAQLTSYDYILTDALVDHVSKYVTKRYTNLADLRALSGLLLDNDTQESQYVPCISRNSGGRYHLYTAKRCHYRKGSFESRVSTSCVTWTVEVFGQSQFR